MEGAHTWAFNGTNVRDRYKKLYAEYTKRPPDGTGSVGAEGLEEEALKAWAEIVQITTDDLTEHDAVRLCFWRLLAGVLLALLFFL